MGGEFLGEVVHRGVAQREMVLTSVLPPSVRCYLKNPPLYLFRRTEEVEWRMLRPTEAPSCRQDGGSVLAA